MSHLPFQYRISNLECSAFQEKKNWRSRLQTTWSGSSLEAYCNQVETCTKIALSCTENDSHRRPSIKDIIDMLKESEIKVTKVINIIIFISGRKVPLYGRWRSFHLVRTSFHYICDRVFLFQFLTNCYLTVPIPLGFKCLLITNSGLLSSKLDTKMWFFRLPTQDRHLIYMSSSCHLSIKLLLMAIG